MTVLLLHRFTLFFSLCEIPLSTDSAKVIDRDLSSNKPNQISRLNQQTTNIPFSSANV